MPSYPGIAPPAAQSFTWDPAKLTLRSVPYAGKRWTDEQGRRWVLHPVMFMTPNGARWVYSERLIRDGDEILAIMQAAARVGGGN